DADVRGVCAHDCARPPASCNVSASEAPRKPVSVAAVYPSGRVAGFAERALWDVRRSLRFDARERDYLGPFIDIFGDELGKLVRRVRWHHHCAKVREPPLDAWIKHCCVGVLVERRKILLVIAGIALALIPGLPRMELAPELVLLGIPAAADLLS